jgi:holo-[acyl-carrier protein] synthase
MDQLGVGIDIENISRFDKMSRTKDKDFLSKIFTKHEIDYCFSRRKPAQHLAARFSAKEAIIKAASQINLDGIGYNEIQIFNSKRGMPSALILKKAADTLNIKVSMSHNIDYAIAVAVLYGGQ